MKDTCFIPLPSVKLLSLIPDELNDPFDPVVPEICKIAATDLQKIMLKNQQQWQDDFALAAGETETIKGKMYGVLIVENSDKEIGYLCTFSGKFPGDSHPSLFVPSLFDISTNDYFMIKGMIELSAVGDQIKKLQTQNDSTSFMEIEQLKINRKAKSVLLQQELFSHYHFFNKDRK
jgi:tRNA pseudouridine32 synthase/23S rRNA pseudouridine746 synthase